MRSSPKDKEIKEKALLIVSYALAQKAVDPVIIDVRGISFLCDYFVILSGESRPQVKAIYEEIIKKARHDQVTVHHGEADPDLQWMLIDFYDIVVHIFLDEARAFYDVEHLWREGKRLRIPKKISESG